MSVLAQDYGYFFNSNNHDRTYNAESFEEWLKPFFISGVFAGSLLVTAQDDPDMTVKVSAGYANLNGKPAHWPEENTLEIATASGVYDRIDTIILRRDNTNRTISIEVVTGTASASPQPTAPTRTADIFELVLAQIRVGVGVTEIIPSKITDTRTDSDLCGYVTATVHQMDFNQFKLQFEGWVSDYEANVEADYAEYMRHLTDYLDAYQDAIEVDETTAAADLLRFKTTLEEYIAELAEIISSGDVAPLQRQIDQLEEDVHEYAWRRPEGLLTDQALNTIEDNYGDPIEITTLSQAEIAAGIINLKGHY